MVFKRTCERRTTPWSDLGTADDDEYRILIDAYKIKNQSNETVMIQAFDNTKLIGHYYEREKGVFSWIVGAQLFGWRANI